MKRNLPVRTAIFACLLLAAPARSASDTPPTDVVRQLIEAVRGFRDEDEAPLTPEQRAHNERAADLANKALGLRGVSEYALGKHWRTLSSGEQRDFVTLVTDLFQEIAYPKSSGFFGDLEIEYGDERIRGERAVVETTVRHPKEGLVAIDYKLRRESDHWVIYDILLDDVSLALDLRSQIQKVLRDESYARLLERMREKLKEG